jgi:hypothetical protein
MWSSRPDDIQHGRFRWSGRQPVLKTGGHRKVRRSKPSAFRQSWCWRPRGRPHHPASVAQWQSRAAPPHRHRFDPCRPHQSPFAWVANLVKAPPSELGCAKTLKPRRGGLATYPRHHVTHSRGQTLPFSPSLRARGAGGSGPLGANPIGARAGSAYLPCKEIELGSSPRCSTKFFPRSSNGRSPGCYPGDPGSNPGRGANSPRSSNWPGHSVLNRTIGVQVSVAAPATHT